MAITNPERVGKAMEALKLGLAPFVSREFIGHYKGQSGQVLSAVLGSPQDPKRPFHTMDVAVLLRVMWGSWNEVFSTTLGHVERSMVSELREYRNRWAHQKTFSGDDTYRVLDTAHRLLTAVSAPQAAEVEELKMELLRTRFDEQARTQRRRTSGTTVESHASSGLPPWREVVSPHPDVASGHYQQAEFAADLWQVHIGQGSDEYRDPAEFFRRTYLTASLNGLLENAMRRLSGNGGEPVVQLQTNFGGGKTHSILALYHLFSGATPSTLIGIEDVMKAVGVETLPAVNRVVLVGNRISPGAPVTKPDGSEVRTLWGEIAWQLGHVAGGPDEARRAFERVRTDDERATNPGDGLRQLLVDYGPALILIDEWVAYARQLRDEGGLPAGSFETQFTFAQALTESAKLPDNCLLVISLPASDVDDSRPARSEDIEVGGVRGREALTRLRNVIGRVDSSWRPASAEESFEIVRRRLFQPLASRDEFASRDNVARACHDLYRTQTSEFPTETAEPGYEKRIKDAYPIHPEVFERLYSDWSTLPTFQRTRGVLRLMASVIHSLWASGDRSPLILPSSIPLDDPHVQFELTRYLPENWTPVIERDIDGSGSRPMQIDGDVPNLGRHSAARRVARSIFLGSAPTPTAANQGLDDRQIKLGCAFPGEPVAVFGDAMRRLADTATFLYRDGARYWYSTQPTVANLAESRAEELRRDPDKVSGEIENRLRADLSDRGDFARVHITPASGQDVQDDMTAGLVVLGAAHPHSGDGNGQALAAATAVLEFRGNAPRLFRNALVFLAPDETRLQDLDQAARRFLAWRSIMDDKIALDLPPHQVRQAETQLTSAEGALVARLGETFQWLLVPDQKDPEIPMEWKTVRLTGHGSLAERVSRRLRGDENLITAYAGTRLRMEMDKVPLWQGDHVSVTQLQEYYARYTYLSRLAGPSVLIQAIRNGLSLLTWEQDSFAYAESHDEEAGRYRGLQVMQVITLSEGDSGLLVRPEAARRQLDREAAAVVPPTPAGPVGPDYSPTRSGTDRLGDTDGNGQPRPTARRYHGSVQLDPTRVGRDAGMIAEEVVAHLVGLMGADVRLTLEIEAEIPEGAPDQIVRTVTENSRTLKFDDSGFEIE